MRVRVTSKVSLTYIFFAYGTSEERKLGRKSGGCIFVVFEWVGGRGLATDRNTNQRQSDTTAASTSETFTTQIAVNHRAAEHLHPLASFPPADQTRRIRNQHSSSHLCLFPFPPPPHPPSLPANGSSSSSSFLSSSHQKQGT